MKNLILLLLILVGTALQAQYTDIKLTNQSALITAFDVSDIAGTDTSFVFKISKLPQTAWSMQTIWTGVTGSGTVALEVTNYDNLTNFIAYSGLTAVTVTGASGTSAWEDYMWGWKYFRIKITKGTLSAGTLNVRININ